MHGSERYDLIYVTESDDLGLGPELVMVMAGDSTESDPESYTASPFSPFGSEHNLEWSDSGSDSSSEVQRKEQEAKCPGTRSDDEVKEHIEEQETMIFPLQGPVKHHKMNHCPPKALG